MISLFGYGFAEDKNILSFATYQSNLTKLTEVKTTISQSKLREKLKEMEKQDCLLEKDGTEYILSPICLLQKKLPTLTVNEVLDQMRENIYGFTNTYNDKLTEFSYEGATPVIKNTSSVALFPTSLKYKAFLISLQEEGKKIRIPKKLIAKEMLDTYTFYVTKKDLTPLKTCTKQNYITAFNSMNNVQIAPQETFTINDHIAYLNGYCKGTGPQDLKFYGGACGFATQLFRTSLLIPQIDIVTRYAYSIWLVPYYSDYIFADDATIYESSKKLIIKNTGTDPIYFKTMNKTKYTYLIAILPKKTDKGVTITKKETDTLAGEVTKSIYNLAKKNIVNTSTFSAKYSSKAYEVR